LAKQKARGIGGAERRMSESQERAIDPAASDLDRNLALLAYALLFFAIFLGGLPALVAVAIAYARRQTAPPWIASHHSFQIWVFWISLGLALLMAGAAMIAFVSAFTKVIGTVTHTGALAGWDEVWVRLSSSNVIALSVVTFFVMFVLTGLWLAGASAYGFVRLASGLSMGQSAGAAATR
jgi:uncharacterized membrane protein